MTARDSGCTDRFRSSRRTLLSRAACGFGSVAAAHLLAGEKQKTDFPPKALSVIFLYMDGGPSQVDTFDYKPLLNRLAGQPLPPSFKEPILAMGEKNNPILGSKRTWKQHGDSGAWFSNLLPNLATQADKLTFIKSSTTVGATHDISILKLNTGDLNPGRPSLGAWINYALGSANPDLPSYVVLYNGDREPSAGSVNWSAGFLPAVYQGTAFRPGDSPILYLERPELRNAVQQRTSLDLLKRLNLIGADQYPHDTELKARLQSYELADRMQAVATHLWSDLPDEEQAEALARVRATFAALGGLNTTPGVFAGGVATMPLGGEGCGEGGAARCGSGASARGTAASTTTSWAPFARSAAASVRATGNSGPAT